MKKISVIIPIYNASLYIKQCIDSIIEQKDVSCEIIAVDDGSSDDSCEIVEAYGDNVTLIKQDNRGASSARNKGLSCATGDYVMFVDADDYLSDPTVCSQCIKRIESEKLDFCLFNLCYLNNNTKAITCNDGFPTIVTEQTDAKFVVTSLVTMGIFPASPCVKVIRKEYLLSNELFFIENTTSEDIPWFTKLIACSTRFSAINSCAYVYRKGLSNSVTGRTTTAKVRCFFNMLVESVTIAQSDRSKKRGIDTVLLSALAYEYSILIGNCAQVRLDKELLLSIKELSWLLKYTLFPRMKYIKWLYSLVGFSLTKKLLGLYINYFAKSNQ